MFETAELGRKVGKKQYNKEVPALRTALLRVQNDLRLEPEFSVLVLIAGVDGAGKGDTVNVLHQWLDPRFLAARGFGPPSDEEDDRPPMWRFWRALPPKGRIGVFFGSWYTDPILARVYGKSSDVELDTRLAEIKEFEGALAANGTLICKFWFHLSKEEQKRRLETLSRDPKLSWRVTELDWQHHGLYDEFVPVCERAIRETSTGPAPWTIVEATDRRYRDLAVGQHLLEAIEQERERPRPEPRARKTCSRKPTGGATILDTVDLSAALEPGVYEEKLEEVQGRLNRLSREAAENRRSALFVFEGWDAAGKGGAIRRVTAALDARFYDVVPIGAPTDEERAHHYLWRFWRHLPRGGHLTIFDRSWYGRVLVERVEGLTDEDEWRRAYKEINEFEKQLRDHGYGLAKFWLHIDKREQRRRFEQREKTPYKKYKITAEDYRNREKWSLYEEAVNEMVERTSTPHAPWTLVPSVDKRFARVKVLDECCRALEAALSEPDR